MKKKFLLSALSLLLVFSSMALIACGDDREKVNPTTTFETTLQSFVEENALFKNSSVQGINTKYYFNNFTSKSGGIVREDDQNYILLNAYAMNYIEEYYPLLTGLKGYKYSSLYSGLDALTESFDEVKVYAQKIADVGEEVEEEVYNGFFANYKYYARDFINDAYSLAMSLSDFLINKVNYTSSLGSDKQTLEVVEFYLDSQILYVFNDYRALLIDSAKGQQLTNSDIYNQAISDIQLYASLARRTVKMPTAEIMADTIDLANHVNGERGYTMEALDNFSIYDFMMTYDGDITSYQKDEEGADAYYAQLQSYFAGDNNYLELFHSYLANNLYE